MTDRTVRTTNAAVNPTDAVPADAVPAGRTPAGAVPGRDGAPEWADGLRQLYDAVVEEPLPDAFKDILEQLDDQPTRGETAGKGAGTGGAGSSASDGRSSR